MVRVNDAINIDTYYANETISNVVEDNSDLTLHGMAQCTGDLQISDCKECLDGVINNLNTKKRGGGIVCGSCYARFWTI
ncbi:hypothetical protein CASFOL_040898 [Castilleja foliolosa]|uniref:Gnk2-homologous domain-containing protein n=1 Tax=Castilleja foliolosa TaxID=1961234 RepID=A0ABD3BD50_9LAMI